MPRRNRHIRWEKGGPSAVRGQKGKGGKRRRDWHHSYGSAQRGHTQPQLPDVGTGADPTTAAPTPVRTRRNRGPAL